jgi:hypothetical protein
MGFKIIGPSLVGGDSTSLVFKGIPRGVAGVAVEKAAAEKVRKKGCILKTNDYRLVGMR